MRFHLIQVFLIAFSYCVVNAETYDEEAGEKLLTFYNSTIVDLCRLVQTGSWNYFTNITPDNEQKMIEAEIQMAKFTKEAWLNITQFDWQNFTNGDTRRQFKILSVLGTAALPEDKYAQLKKIISKMSEIYSTTKICKFNDPTICNLNLEPEITELLMESHNYDELLDAWTQWHTKVGRAIKPYYSDYVRLGNEAARLNGLNDLGEIWRYPYEDNNFQKNIESLWTQLKPFYLQLHAYMRRQLVKIYGEAYVSSTGPIPAHLLGNMWAQEWSSLYNLTKPFDSLDESDVTSKMKEQNYTVNRMFRMSEDFFTSLGMEPMTDEFWNNSMFVRPSDGREVVCHASAWDFCDGRDYRIKQCTKIRYDDLITVHHEMGHIQYFQQYRHQPFVFRDGANPGFHEAIGDVMALSVSSEKHLAKFNLSDFKNETTGADINFLYQIALRKLAFLPFGYVMDYWRWQVFKGDIPESNWNVEWWKLRREYQGIEPAVDRSPEDFDPAAKFHIPGDTPYDRYFVAHILQFQFHKALCELAGEYNSTDPYKPLHHCDIYDSPEAGERFSEVMKLGYSKPWPETLKLFVGQDKMDASPLIEYFKPLIDFLVKDNEKNKVKIGWE